MWFDKVRCNLKCISPVLLYKRQSLNASLYLTMTYAELINEKCPMHYDENFNYNRLESIEYYQIINLKLVFFQQAAMKEYYPENHL